MTMADGPAFPRAGLTPDRVRSTTFSRAALSRRGYNEEEVRMFLGRIAEEIAAFDSEKARLREEINRLKTAMREWQSKQADRRTGPAPTVEAVNMLSAAQQQADAYVAQAQEYCRQLTEHTRQQADAILLEAQKRAGIAAERAVHSYRREAGARYTAEIEELERRATWLRTFVHAVQVQMRAASEAFTREVAKLTDLPPVEPPSGAVPEERTGLGTEQLQGSPDRPRF